MKKLKEQRPDANGYYGKFGGRFIPETLVPAFQELEKIYKETQKDPKFKKEFNTLLKEYAGRPTNLYFAENLTKLMGGAKIYLKREDLLHTGAHKINNAIGQILLAKKMKKTRIIAETGAGQHGVATATVAAKFGIKCVVYMGEVDMERQALNVFRMKLLGAEVVKVTSGTRTLKDAVNEALRDWTKNVKDTHYLLGSALGPHPFPLIVRNFQSCIGKEAKKQILKLENKLPDAIVACVGGGSNAIGIFYEFINDLKTDLIGVEAGGFGIKSGKHAARFCDPKNGKPGVLHGSFTYLLQNRQGQIFNTHSISAGLDYSAVGPEHSYLKELKRAKYTYATDVEALKALELLSQTEGIIPALESAHAVAYGTKLAKKMKKDQVIIINLSGRGDKDMEQVAKIKGNKNNG